MKKILIITNHSFMLWQFRRELIGAMLERGCDVAISVPFGDHIDDFRAMGCRMIDTPLDRRGINPVKDLALFRTYRKLLAEERPDMVITYSIKPNIYGGYACRLMGIPCCINVQGLGTAFQKRAIAQVVTVMYREAVKKAKVVFFENQGNAALFREKKITPAAQQLVLPGAGINLDFHGLEAYPENEVPHFLYLGRLMKEKGIDELFAAVRRLKAEGYAFKLDLVGFFEDEYKEQVAQLKQEGIAEFHGFQPDPRPWYAAADCIVLPSYHEGMSNVLLEAAATGRPIIASDIPGCQEALVNGATGFTCRVKDADSLHDAMVQLLSLTTEQRRAMGLAGRDHIEEHFNKKQVVAKVLSAVFK